MASFDLLEFAAVAFLVCGLGFVVWEVVAKRPHGMIELLTDVRGFAERPQAEADQPGDRATAPRAQARVRRVVA